MATKITGTNTAAAPGITGDDTDTGLFYGTNEIGFSTGGTSRATIDSNGNLKMPVGTSGIRVGDDTDSNAGTQTISVGSFASGKAGGLQLWANSTNGNSFIQFGDSATAADHYRGYINYKHAEDSLSFGASGAEALRIDSSGNVLIGTTSANKRLTLVDRTDPIALVIGENDNATTDAGLRIQARNTANSSGFSLDIAVDADASAATFDFGGSERLRIASNGQVGIGGTPAYTLDVTAPGDEAQLRLNSGSGNHGMIRFSQAGTNKSYIQHVNGDHFAFGPGGTERLRIDSSGRVGIGSTAPAASTTIFGGTQNCLLLAGSAAPQLRIASDTSNQGDLILQAGNSGADVFIANIASNGDIVFRTHNGSAHGERVRIYDDGDVKIADGNLVIGTSGHGIDFSATSDGAGTDTSELLDDYEEGSFSMTFTGSGGAMSTMPITTNNCRYTKIGRLVHYDCYIAWNTSGAGGSGTLHLAGLPYAQSGNSTYSAVTFGWLNMDGFAEDEILMAWIINSSSTIQFQRHETAGTGRSYTNMAISAVHSSGSFGISGTYQTD